jgi:hypothetical protein
LKIMYGGVRESAVDSAYGGCGTVAGP